MADTDELAQCEHPGMPEVPFDAEKAKTMSAREVRKAYPRLSYFCPHCKSPVIGYASFEHYIAGDY